ncbi:MAG: fluoride efflux transporter CrcB [Fimbriimonadales bacterium]|nr:fluoride efflux transporter CrcB [Fimbriimonadales bacterium]
MESFSRVLLVACGGAIGAALRYSVGGWLQGRMGAVFPWETMIINLSGSLLIGLVLGLIQAFELPSHARLFLAIGILGGFTTYSTFAYETLVMFSQRRWLPAIFYMQFTAFGTVFCAWCGLVVARILAGGRV